MLHPPPPDRPSLGADLRALRRARGRTLDDLASALGRSVGWLSQVERDLSTPAIDDLRQIASELGVPLSMLFGQPLTRPEEQGIIVRKNTRRRIGSREAGLVEELLSPDLTDDFEVVHSTFLPRSRLKTPVSRPTQELGYVVSGRLDLQIGPHPYTLDPGDSFRIRGESFRWANPYAKPAQVIWIIAPPVY